MTSKFVSHSQEVWNWLKFVKNKNFAKKKLLSYSALRFLSSPLSSIEDESGTPLVQSYPSQYRHLQWVSNQTLLMVSSDPGGVGSTLFNLSLLDEELEKPRLVIK